MSCVMQPLIEPVSMDAAEIEHLEGLLTLKQRGLR